MPSLASTPVTAPAEGSRGLARPLHPKGGSSDRSGDADFGEHLARVAGGDESAGRSAGARRDHERAVARRHARDEVETLPDRGRNAGAGLEALSTPVANTDNSTTLMVPPAGPAPVANDLADLAAAAIALPAEARGAAVSATAFAAGRTRAASPATALRAEASEAARVMSRAGEGNAIAAWPGESAGSADLPHSLEGMPVSPPRGVRPEARDRAYDVVIVGRETHLSPATAAATARAALPAAPRPGAGRDAVEPHTAPALMPPKATAAGPSLAAGLPSHNGEHGNDGDPTRIRRAISGGVTGGTASSPAGVRAADEGELDASPAGRAAGSVNHDVEPLPQLPASLPRQIADGIAADLSRVGRANIDPSAATTTGGPAQPLRVLTIQLHPAELGMVTVRIALKDGVLELQVEASRRETARLVDADRDTLSGLLRSAGYHVETMTVRAVEPAGTAAPAGAPQPAPDGAAQPQSDGSQADARPHGGRTQAEQDGNTHGTRRDTGGEPDGPRHRAGRGLYV
jgi:chemotaxis protein MotD